MQLTKVNEKIGLNKVANDANAEPKKCNPSL